MQIVTLGVAGTMESSDIIVRIEPNDKQEINLTIESTVMQQFGKQIDRIHEVLPLISVISIVMIISGIVAVNKEKVITSGLLVLGIVVLHNIIGMLTGLGIAKIFHIEYSKATAIAIEVGMQNSGLAVSLAAANFASNPLATLPGAIFSVWHNISGSVFAGIRRRGMRE